MNGMMQGVEEFDLHSNAVKIVSDLVDTIVDYLEVACMSNYMRYSTNHFCLYGWLWKERMEKVQNENRPISFMVAEGLTWDMMNR